MDQPKPASENDAKADNANIQPVVNEPNDAVNGNANGANANNANGAANANDANIQPVAASLVCSLQVTGSYS
jgi:hypothetical protein